MADMYVKELDMINPFVIASSPATQGVRNVIKTSAVRPGAIVLRNFGHGMGGGSYIGPNSKAMFSGQQSIHSHAVGTQVKDPINSLEEYCEEVKKIKASIDKDIKLWVSVGHYSDIVKGGDWDKYWVRQAKELTLAGADALELHFNTPGVAVAKDRSFNYYQLVSRCTEMIKKATNIPVMVKLAVEACDPLTAIKVAQAAGADAVGPTARWKGFYMDLNWKETQARPGSGYGGTQANPIVCYAVAEARSKGIDIPMFAGGGVFSYDQAARILMAGSQCVQVGALACAGGVGATKKMMNDLGKWMDQAGYESVAQLTGDALKLFNMSSEVAAERTRRIGTAYRERAVDAAKCVGCSRCVDVCWHEGVEFKDGKAVKTDKCIGCGYCFQVCPTGALEVETGKILASVFDEMEG